MVAIDIGGTHARFALAQIVGGQVALGECVTFSTRDHASFHAAWSAFARRGSLPRAAAIAVAGPVGGDVIRFTNNPWIIEAAKLGGEIGLDHLTLVNDFAAVGHAVLQAAPEYFQHLTGPDAPLPTTGTISVIGPGTGLGVAYVRRDGQSHVQATEGGHGDFAPLDAFEDALLARLRQEHGRVSVERVVSGPAILDIYAVLAGLAGQDCVPYDDRQLWQAGIEGSDALAVAAVERFSMALGAVAGDLALAQGASAVVIAGGLGLRLQHTLAASGFAARFCAKGRFAAMMAAMPVKLITHPQPGLLGAAAAFAREHLT